MLLKFTINQRLKNIPAGEYNERLKELLSQIDVPYNTFRDWRNIKYGEAKSIPADKLKLIADFFGCSMEDLFTQNEDSQKMIDKVLKSQKITTPKQ